MAVHRDITGASPTDPYRGSSFNRRDLFLAAATTALLGGAVVTVVTPEDLRSTPTGLARRLTPASQAGAAEDARLVQACRAFLDANDSICQTRFDHAAGSAAEKDALRARAPLEERQHLLGDDIADLRAVSIEGLALKARCTIAYGDAAESLAESPFLGDRLLGSLLQDLLALDPAAKSGAGQ